MPIWLSLIMFLLEHIPDIINIVKTIIDLIHHAPAALRPGLFQELKDAAKTVITTKDRRPLKALMDKVRALIGAT